MNNDMGWFHPTVATTCYGMNDGGYSPQTPDKSTEPWDYYNIAETFKGDAAWTTKSESKCAMWK